MILPEFFLGNNKAMFKKLSIIALSLLLTACLYRPNMQQGNVVTSDMRSQVKVGMTQEQVRYLLGTPVLVNTFDPNRWDYVYTFRHGSDPMIKQNVSLIFSNGILQKIDSTPLVKIPPLE